MYYNSTGGVAGGVGTGGLITENGGEYEMTKILHSGRRNKSSGLSTIHDNNDLIDTYHQHEMLSSKELMLQHSESIPHFKGDKKNQGSVEDNHEVNVSGMIGS